MNIIQRMNDLKRVVKDFELQDVMWEIVIPEKSTCKTEEDTIRRVGPITLDHFTTCVENGLVVINDDQLNFVIQKLCITIHAYVDQTKYKKNSKVTYCGEG